MVNRSFGCYFILWSRVNKQSQGMCYVRWNSLSFRAFPTVPSITVRGALCVCVSMLHKQTKYWKPMGTRNLFNPLLQHILRRHWNSNLYSIPEQILGKHFRPQSVLPLSDCNRAWKFKFQSVPFSGKPHFWDSKITHFDFVVKNKKYPCKIPNKHIKS